MTKHALVTGSAGFIGSHLVDRLLAQGWAVTGLDNFDPYYDEAQKRRNMSAHLEHPSFDFIESDIRDAAQLDKVSQDVDTVVHLAAKAGVRNSLLDPLGYQMTNVVGTQNLLTFAHERGIKSFVCASSSSVYGNCPRLPWSEDDLDLLPINPYASTKLACEHLGYVYAKTFGMSFVGLRFFTVYGPRQRPDLAIHKFARKMLAGEPIPVYGDGTSERDYTYCDDIVSGVVGSMNYAIESPAGTYDVFNLGHNRTVTLIDMIKQLEGVLDREAIIDWQDWQLGDMRRTYATIDRANRAFGYQPETEFVDGLGKFSAWLNETLALEAR
jgi:UDP-glucuronate 4-epimerase